MDTYFLHLFLCDEELDTNNKINLTMNATVL